MFCYKCGTAIEADEIFCHKCGTRVDQIQSMATENSKEEVCLKTDKNKSITHAKINDKTNESVIEKDFLETDLQFEQEDIGFKPISKKQKDFNAPDNSKRIKRKRIALYILIVIMLGIIALLIACIINPEIWYGKHDYIDIIKRSNPYSESDANIDMVFKRYISDTVWTVREGTFDPAYVDVSGSVVGDSDIRILFKVESVNDGKAWKIVIDDMSFGDGMKVSQDFANNYLKGLFMYYEMGIIDASNLRKTVEEVLQTNAASKFRKTIEEKLQSNIAAN